MKRRTKIFCIIAFFAVWAGLAAVFGKYDLQIELALYHPQSQWALFLEREGLITLPIIITFCLHMLLKINIFLTGAKWKNLFHVLIGLLLLISGFFVYYRFELLWRQYLFIVVYAIGLAAILHYQLDRTRCEQWRRVVFIVLVAAALTFVIVSVLKLLAGRLRFRDMQSLQEFVPWYLFHPFSGNASFPSGHTANAASTFFFYFLVPIAQSKPKKIFFAAIPTVFVPTMAISRIIIGAHYPSDVLFAIGIAIVCWWTSAYFYDKFTAKKSLR